MANRVLQMVGRGDKKTAGVEESNVETTAGSTIQENPMHSSDESTIDNEETVAVSDKRPSDGPSSGVNEELPEQATDSAAACSLSVV